MTNIALKGCGTYLVQLPDSVKELLRESSLLYSQPSYASALLFVESKVTVSIEASFGFAIIGLNLHSSYFHFLKICNSTQQFENETSRTGSGMLICFNDSKQSLPTTTNILLNNTTFEKNQELFNKLTIHNTKHSISNAAGLTIFYTQTQYEAHVSILGGKFYNNIEHTEEDQR